MKKKSLLVSLLLVLVMVLAVGCGNNGDTPTDTLQDTPAAQLEGKILVSAAASLQAPMDEAYALYKKAQPNVTVEFNYGGSGALIEQIVNGAPADVFISANTKFMDEGVEKDVIDTASRFDWLKNTMAVIVPANSDLKMETIEDVKGATTIALGAVESVPAGQYAKEALEKANVWQDVEGKVVYGKDVKQVAVYVESGSADVGFVYSTDTVGRENIKIAFVLGDDMVAPIIYPAALVKDSASPEVAANFLEFLKTPVVAEIFTNYGFEIAK